jgi:hypothetical protein
MSKVIYINDLTCNLLDNILVIKSNEFAPICQSYPTKITNVSKNGQSEFQINVSFEDGTTVVFDIPQCPICLNGYTEDNGKCQLSCSHSICDNCISQMNSNNCPLCKKSCINTHMHIGLTSQSIKNREKKCNQCLSNKSISSQSNRSISSQSNRSISSQSNRSISSQSNRSISSQSNRSISSQSNRSISSQSNRSSLIIGPTIKENNCSIIVIIAVILLPILLLDYTFYYIFGEFLYQLFSITFCIILILYCTLKYKK